MCGVDNCSRPKPCHVHIGWPNMVEADTTPDWLKPAEWFVGKRSWFSPQCDIDEKDGKVVRIEVPWVDNTTRERGSVWVTPQQLEAWPQAEEFYREYLLDWAFAGKAPLALTTTRITEVAGKTPLASNDDEASDSEDDGHGGFVIGNVPRCTPCEAHGHDWGGTRIAQCSGGAASVRCAILVPPQSWPRASHGVQRGTLLITRRSGELRLWFGRCLRWRGRWRCRWCPPVCRTRLFFRPRGGFCCRWCGLCRWCPPVCRSFCFFRPGGGCCCRWRGRWRGWWCACVHRACG
jgi:hypothetical protein